eukprot:scaffold75582_cov66-Phaeocystis_antarctica.AAC.1
MGGGKAALGGRPGLKLGGPKSKPLGKATGTALHLDVAGGADGGARAGRVGALARLAVGLASVEERRLRGRVVGLLAHPRDDA